MMVGAEGQVGVGPGGEKCQVPQVVFDLLQKVADIGCNHLGAQLQRTGGLLIDGGSRTVAQQ